jgi:hypothetical protein
MPRFALYNFVTVLYVPVCALIQAISFSRIFTDIGKNLGGHRLDAGARQNQALKAWTGIKNDECT